MHGVVAAAVTPSCCADFVPRALLAPNSAPRRLTPRSTKLHISARSPRAAAASSGGRRSQQQQQLRKQPASLSLRPAPPTEPFAPCADSLSAASAAARSIAAAAAFSVIAAAAASGAGGVPSEGGDATGPSIQVPAEAADASGGSWWDQWKARTQGLKEKVAKLGLSAVLAYGLFDGVTYTTFFVLAFLGYEKSTGLNPAANLKALLGIVVLMWTGNNVTRPFRVAGAAAAAPFLDKALKRLQEKLNLPSQFLAFALVAGSFGSLCLSVVGLLILSRLGG